MADKSRCRKQTHELVGEGVGTEAEVAEEAVDLEGEEVAMAGEEVAIAGEVAIAKVSSSSYSCTYSTAQGSANYQNYCSHQLVFVWLLMHSHFMAM